MGAMSEPKGEWVKVEAGIDSAAVDVVVPRGFTLHVKTRESTWSKEGRRHVGVNNTIIETYGEKDLNFCTDRFKKQRMVADSRCGAGVHFRAHRVADSRPLWRRRSLM